MKRSLIVAASLAALCSPGAATALNTQVIREVQSAGLPFSNFLGQATFMALGAQGAQFCAYLMQWQSPYNPNDVQLCLVREQRTPVKPSCIVNSVMDIASFVSAGPGAQGGPTLCTGFDNLGVARPRVTLLLGEYPGEVPLQGVAIYAGALPLVLGVIVV